MSVLLICLSESRNSFTRNLRHETLSRPVKHNAAGQRADGLSVFTSFFIDGFIPSILAWLKPGITSKFPTVRNLILLRTIAHRSKSDTTIIKNCVIDAVLKSVAMVLHIGYLHLCSGPVKTTPCDLSLREMTPHTLAHSIATMEMFQRSACLKSAS